MRCSKCGYTQWKSSESSCCAAAQKAVEAQTQTGNSYYAAALRAVDEFNKLDPGVKEYYSFESWLEERLNSEEQNCA